MKLKYFPVLALCLTVTGATAAPVLQLGVEPPGATNEFTAAPQITWTAEGGVNYVVQTSTNLAGASGWQPVDLLARASGGTIRYTGTDLEGATKFFRVVTQPQVFDVQPSFVNSSDSSAVLYLTGQLLPTNGIVVINGQNFSATPETNGVLSVSLNGLPPGTPIIGSLAVLDAASNVVATLPVQSPIYYGPAMTTEQLQGPPTEPPASPAYLGMKVKEKGNRTKCKSNVDSAIRTIGDEECDDGNPVGIMRWLTKKGYDYYQAQSDLNTAGLHNNPAFQDNANQGSIPGMRRAGKIKPLRITCERGQVNDPASRRTPEDCDDTDCGVIPATGEFRCAETDLAIPGAMMDFAWTRTYRSRTGPTTAQGAGWDFSYNVSLTQNGDGTITLRPGNGRADTFYQNGTNWVRDEYFCEIRDLDTNGYPDVLFADTSRWLFNPLGTPAGGKLARIMDRNGNLIMLTYDTSGQLAEIVDDLGRTNSVGYDTSGRIASVTDFTGRMVRYEYSTAGDLVAVISPPVVGTPTGNDFPGGITNRYSYTSGFANAAENHLLLSVVDGKGQVRWQHVYQHNQTDLEFLRCISVQEGANPPTQLRYFPHAINPQQHFATTRCIVNDPVGNVSEGEFDSRGRCVALREFTGRAVPGVAVTDTVNRPTGKLRADDPDYFEAKWAWNLDSLCTLETLPDGQRTQFIYERDFDSAASARKKGDCRVARALAAPGGGADLDGDGVNDISELAWHFDYDPRFGSPAARGKKLYVGNLPYSAPESPLAAAKVRYKGWDGTIKGTSRLAADGDNTPIIKGSALGGLARAGYIGSSCKGKDVVVTKQKGWNGTVKVNDDEDGSSVLRHKYKGWDGTVRGFTDDSFVTKITNPRGNVTTAEYAANGNLSRVVYVPPSDRWGSGIDSFYVALGYNTKGQLTAITNAPDANNYRRVDKINYYASGSQAGHLQSIAIDEPGMHLTSSFEYDARGNLTRYVDPRTNDWLFTYNALDQCVRAQSPVNLTARSKTDFIYDANGNVQDAIEELRDESDTFIRNITTHCDFDSLDRCIALAEQVSPGTFITNRFDYDANDNLVAAHSPLALSGADPHAIAQFEYDERGLLFREIAALGTPQCGTNEYNYTPSGSLAKASLGLGFSAIKATFTQPAQRTKNPSSTGYQMNYDSFHRPSALTDDMGNVTTFTYDRNGNCTLVRHFGETNDVPGGAGNILLAQTAFSYDALDRCTQAKDSFFDPATGAPIGKGAATTTFAYAPNGACTSVTDDNGHTTRYGYDTVGRLNSVSSPGNKTIATGLTDASGNFTIITQTDVADGGGTQVFTTEFAYDALGRCVASWDNVGNTNRCAYDSLGRCVRTVNPNGNTTWFAYDDLDRCLVRKADSDGDGVPELTDATSSWAYDANSRCLAAADANGNLTQYAYDSLGNTTSVTNADGTVMKLIWSPRSNLLSSEDPNGTTVTNTYNLRNNIVHRDLACRNVLATTTFENFSYNGLGQCVSAQNDVSTSTFAYDSLGNCVRTTQDGLTTTYTYDGVGNNLSMTYPSGRVVTYTYNEVDDVSSLSSSAGGGLPSTTLATYTYAGPGRLKGIARANGVSTAWQWDGMQNPANASGDYGWLQVRGVSHSAGGLAIDQRRCDFDRNQNRVARTLLAPVLATGLETNLFGYDALDRQHHFINLKTSGIAAFQDLSLDNMGNRLAETNESVAGVYSMLATIPPGDFQMNRYSTTPFGFQAYDANGNLQAGGNAMSPTLYGYDYAGRLVQVSAVDSLGGVSVVASYAYDALGRRISKTIYPSSAMEPPVTTYFVKGREQCDDGNLDSGDGCNTEERVLGSTSNRVYVWGGSADFVCFNGSPSPQYAHCDDLGNLLALTDSSGAVLERYSYGAFGAPAFLAADGSPKTGSDGVSPAKVSDFGMSRLFRGMVWEDAVGLYRCGENPLYEGGGAGQNPLFDPQTGRATRGKVKSIKDMGNSGLVQDNPWSLKKEEGGRHTPFQNRRVPGKHGSQRDYIPQSNFAIEIN